MVEYRANNMSVWDQIKSNVTAILACVGIVVSVVSQLVTLRLTASAHEIRLDKVEVSQVKLEANFTQTASAINSINDRLEILVPNYRKK